MTATLRVLFLTSSLRQGGAERQSITLLSRLVERGHVCRLVHIKHADHPLELTSCGTACDLGATRYLDRGAIRRLTAEISGFRPSVIVAVNPYALMYAALALPGSGLRTRLAVTYHTTRLLGLKEHLQTLFYRPFFWRADCTIFVCGEQRRYAQRRAIFSRRNESIYNGVDTSFYNDTDDGTAKAAQRLALGFEDTDFVIGISAWMRPEKNHAQLVDALTALRARGIPARALMIGDGQARAGIERHARELGVDKHIAITGAQTDVRPFVAICDVMVICSVAVETFSLAALEAMAMGKPVIHSDLGGATELITKGQNGYVFPVGDTGALVEKLTALSDPAVAYQMGVNARNIVKAQFSEATMVDHYERLLLELCLPAQAQG
jgi:L-malate glycosyltransferase